LISDKKIYQQRYIFSRIKELISNTELGPIPKIIQKGGLGYKIYNLKNILTNENLQFKGLEKLCSFLKLSDSTISRALASKSLLYNKYVISVSDEYVPFTAEVKKEYYTKIAASHSNLYTYGLINILTNNLDYLFEGQDSILSHLDFSRSTLTRKINSESIVIYNGNKYKITRDILDSQITDKTIKIKS